MGSRGGGGQDNAAGPARGAVTNPPWHRRALICETNWPPLEKKKKGPTLAAVAMGMSRLVHAQGGYTSQSTGTVLVPPELGIPLGVLLARTPKGRFLFFFFFFFR